eukprot:376073-Pyramimonas_sp.AAC.1
MSPVNFMGLPCHWRQGCIGQWVRSGGAAGSASTSRSRNTSDSSSPLASSATTLASGGAGATRSETCFRSAC